jgi:anionic cell wall polymer biosynthesis LytR-Cps2A-Psr (LCP) family protein
VSDETRPDSEGPTSDPFDLPVPSLEPYPGQAPEAEQDQSTDVEATAPVPVVDGPSDSAAVGEPADGGRAARRRAADAAAAADVAAGGASEPSEDSVITSPDSADAAAAESRGSADDVDATDDGPVGQVADAEAASEPGGWAPQPVEADDSPATDLPADWSEAQSAGGRAARRRATEDAARVQSHRAHNRLVIVGVAAIVVLALAGLAWTWLSRQTPAPDPQPTASPSATGPTQPTLLLQVADDQGVAVSNALLSVGGPLGRANVISIPQNTLMDVATGGTLPFGQINRLPDPNGSAGALSDAIGVDVNGTLVLDPGALSGLVDAVGGITADVDVDVTQEKADGTTLILVPAGPGQVLQGQQAEAYATFLAKGENEEARMARFAQVLRLTVAKLPADSAKIETILTQLGASARATVPFTQLADFFLRLNADVNADDVAYKNLPVQGIDTGGPAAYRVDQEAAAAMVQDLLPEALRTPGPNSKVRVLVQNGVGSPGLNTAARTLLVDAGFTFVNGGNASSFGQAKTNVILPDTTPESLAWGADIVKALGLPDTAVKVAEDGQSVADVIVVLGEDFTPTAP